VRSRAGGRSRRSAGQEVDGLAVELLGVADVEACGASSTTTSVLPSMASAVRLPDTSRGRVTIHPAMMPAVRGWRASRTDDATRTS